MTFISAIVIFSWSLLTKMIAITFGYKAFFKVWFTGLLVGVLGGFLSQGIIFILLCGSFGIKTIPKLRIGKFFPHYNPTEDAWIQFLSLASLLVLATVVKAISVENTFFFLLMKMLVSIAFFSLLPLPWIPGGRIWFCSHYLYLFSIGYVALFGSLIMFSTFSVALFGGVIGGLAWMALFHMLQK